MTSKKPQVQIIEHRSETGLTIKQRPSDGYINATKMCKDFGKQLGHYLENDTTKAFLNELSSDIGKPISELVEIIKGGNSKLQGTYVHPYVAINLGQWVSPSFAVFVSKLVNNWFLEEERKINKKTTQDDFSFHLYRYSNNAHKIPNTHFSILSQMVTKLLALLNNKGYVISNDLMPDIALGLMFNKWLRSKGYDPNSFDTYQHEFNDGIRPTVTARLYPNELLTDFNKQMDEWIISGKALKYFESKDPNSIKAINMVYVDLIGVERLRELDGKL